MQMSSNASEQGSGSEEFGVENSTSTYVTKESGRRGFTTLLRKTLRALGCHEEVWYKCREYKQHGQHRCSAAVTIPESSHQEGWETWTETAIGSDKMEAIEAVAHGALRRLCEEHIEELADEAATLFPIRNQIDGTWLRNVEAAREKTLTGEKDLVTPLFLQSLAMFNLYEETAATAQYDRRALGRTHKKLGFAQQKVRSLQSEKVELQVHCENQAQRIADLEQLSAFKSAQLQARGADQDAMMEVIHQLQTQLAGIQEDLEHVVHENVHLQQQVAGLLEAQQPPPANDDAPESEVSDGSESDAE